MKSLAHLCTIASLALFTVDVHTQTTAYFPHQLGDMWEYFVLDGVGNDTLRVRVIFDSTDPSGSSHVKHHRQLLNPVRPPWFPWYTEFKAETSGSVFGTGFLPPNSLVYRFDVQVGQWWFVYHQGGPGGDVAKLLNQYPSTVFSQPTTIKEIAYFSASDTSDTTIWLRQYTELLAEGFGTLFRGDGDLGYNLYLRGCVIDGVPYGDTTLVSIAESRDEGLPEGFILYQNYPNPFNPQTTIPFSISRRAEITLVIHDILGKEVLTIVDRQMYAAGRHEVTWDSATRNGIQATTGVYLLRLRVDEKILTRRMLLLR